MGLEINHSKFMAQECNGLSVYRHEDVTSDSFRTSMTRGENERRKEDILDVM
jgi:hypothetical protein